MPLAELTTLRLGGPAGRLVRADSAAAVVETVRAADREGAPLLLVGGGSNLVVADAGVPGTTVQVCTTGRSVRPGGPGTALLTVAAGEDWDTVVADALDRGLTGLECLSGIPGRAGAVPVQNVGAYGVEIAELLVDVDLYDRRSGVLREHVPAAELRLGYRTSALKGTDAAVVLRIRLALFADPSGLSPRSGTPSWPGCWVSSWAGARRPPRCGRPCWGCAGPKGWCSPSTITTRGAPARSSPTRCWRRTRCPPCWPGWTCRAGRNPTAG